jgi:hypothetical protein
MVVVAQLVRASDCGSGGRGFEPHHPPKTLLKNFDGVFYFQDLNSHLALAVKPHRIIDFYRSVDDFVELAFQEFLF